ncbi:hypothetical protein BC832DRAFT_278745 [Gaertneriomyces semiglobifer]|nr:hypothetical protein BC832DRAFT_278745 [Gaertneriomyces semiglobifer]
MEQELCFDLVSRVRLEDHQTARRRGCLYPAKATGDIVWRPVWRAAAAFACRFGGCDGNLCGQQIDIKKCVSTSEGDTMSILRDIWMITEELPPDYEFTVDEGLLKLECLLLTECSRRCKEHCITG